jgi:hypothetical protein
MPSITQPAAIQCHSAPDGRKGSKSTMTYCSMFAALAWRYGFSGLRRTSVPQTYRICRASYADACIWMSRARRSRSSSAVTV